MDNSNILANLQNIKEQTAQLNKVAFVFQPWIEFNNLGNDGYRIPAVPSPVIPRMSLIPLVSINPKHIESRLNSSTNKYVPLPIAYVRPIHSSYIDLLQRYGRYGLVKLDPLACDLDAARRTMELFELMMEPFHKGGGLLEDLCDYFGKESPVSDQIENPVKRVKTTAELKLTSMVTHLLMTEEEKQPLLDCIPVLAKSAETAHRTALMPSIGVLTQSIQEINEKRKPKFDEVDVFLKKQFPGYNSDSLLSHRGSNNDLAALTEVLKQLVNDRNTPAPLKEAAVADVERVAPQLVLPVNGQSDAETGKDLGSTDIPTVKEPSSESLDRNPFNCQGTTKAGGQCKAKPDPSAEYSAFCLGHQEQGKLLAEEMMSEAKAMHDEDTQKYRDEHGGRNEAFFPLEKTAGL